MTTLNQLLDDFQGMRNDVATAITDRFDSVSGLASASVDRLTEIKGVGTATAERLIETAKSAAKDAGGGPGTTTPARKAPANVPAPDTTGAATEPTARKMHTQRSSGSLLDRAAAVAGGALGVGVGLLRSVQRRLSS